MPENQPRAARFLNAEKLQLWTEAPVIAALGFFQPMEISGKIVIGT